MKGTPLSVNKAMLRPVMIGGVEKKLALLNALISFPLVAATHFRFPACFIGVLFYVIVHAVFRFVSKSDPHLGKLFKRSTRYAIRAYFPAKSHPSVTAIWKVKTVSRPR